MEIGRVELRMYDGYRWTSGDVTDCRACDTRYVEADGDMNPLPAWKEINALFDLIWRPTENRLQRHVAGPFL
jgi:hypothetical protein